jgi:ADP-dependent NAD(P)H-hydrate dehydratase / NAD(P)H-hydrate epimerase
MKILPVDLIRKADAYTIEHEPIRDIDLMERAALKCAEWLTENIPQGSSILVYAGTGNNGGDGFAIARILKERGYEINVVFPGDKTTCTTSCRTNFHRWIETASEPLKDAIQPEVPDVIVDALLGSGLSRPAEGKIADAIEYINDSGAIVVSVDVPSGLYCDKTNQDIKKPFIVNADYTLTFSPPKLSFMFPENDAYTGTWILLDIGISLDYIDSCNVSNFFTDQYDILGMLKRRGTFSHKGTFGHALLVCGSEGKMGAAVLSGKACIRSGPGLVSMLVPDQGIPVINCAAPECMTIANQDHKQGTDLPDLAPFNVIGAGPGIGTGPETSKRLKHLIQEAKDPMVLDADAINILSENKTWLSFIPGGSIFTPHPREFERIAGKSTDDFDRNRRQREFSVKFNCYVVLKGAFTAVTTPEGKCYFNPTGNPGMATGGSGDVLTGIITGLKARGYSSFESSILGVYVHGLAGDLAAEDTGYEALIAGDIITYLGKAFQKLYGKF